VWQFQFEGTRYIGDSAFNQLDRIIFSPGPRDGTAVHWRDKKRVNRQTSSDRLHSNSELWPPRLPPFSDAGRLFPEQLEANG
jgi:hypothetical protein